MITKCVIAAAGRGTRFLPVVKSYPKELVPILSKPNIQYLIEEAIGAGITQIAIVHRLGENSIEKYFTPDADLEKYLTENNKLEYLDSLKTIWSKAKLTFIPQPTNLPYGTGSPVLAAKEFIDQNDFAYFYGDDLILEPTPGQLLTKMMAKFDQYSASAVMAVQEVSRDEIYRYGSVRYATNSQYPDQMVEICEKLSVDLAPSTSVNIGRFVSKNEILKYIDINQLSRDGELWFTDALTKLALENIVLTQKTQDETWTTTGDPLRWLESNIAMALKDPNYNSEISRFLQNLRSTI